VRCPLFGNRLEPSVEHFAVSQGELANNCREERDAFYARLEEGERRVFADDLQGNAGNSRPRPDVENARGGRGEKPREQEAVQNDVIGDPAGISRADEALTLVPFNE